MKINFDHIKIRNALLELPDVSAQENLSAPSINNVYVPIGHQKALSFETTIVVGMRGAGKSLWTSVLFSKTHRDYVANQIGSELLKKVIVRVGFGLDQSNSFFPAEGTLKKLISDNFEPSIIWQTVVLRHALGVCNESLPFHDDWGNAVQWTATHQEEADNILARCDNIFEEKGTPLLVIFDALDRFSEDWKNVRSLLIGALRFGLRCRTFRKIRLKFFLRPDMEEDAEIWKFPDSSKLRHSKVELTWKTSDLYGLIFHYLANSVSSGESFRNILSENYSCKWQNEQDVYNVPHEIINKENLIRTIIESICGEWMGKSAKRGFTYTWIPTHLADASTRISPRSLLLAFKQAAEITNLKYSYFNLALHYEAIQEGVTAASLIRVQEITEDYPWVEPLLEAVRGSTVPLLPKDLTIAWTNECVQKVKQQSRIKLPPRRFDTDPYRQGSINALIDDLVELSVFYRTADNRINMPDIFRVGFGVKRKGGVKPPRK
jgi:hypothetical protein